MDIGNNIIEINKRVKNHQGAGAGAGMGAGGAISFMNAFPF